MDKVFTDHASGKDINHTQLNPFKVVDRVSDRRGWTGAVVKVDDNSAWVDFDNGEPSSPFPRDELNVDGGVLWRI
ncbi:MAG: hypothetical protein K2X97_22365 [Mycobacteriaceae bacterium]|nr:hypothetical protein [Mycobacteriaceae bacterium]